MASVIDQSTMTGTGSSLSLNGQTFGVGVQTGLSQLKSVSDLAKVSGVSMQGEVIYISKAGLVLDGYDLRNTNIVVTGSNVTIKNTLFNTKTGYSTVYQEAGASGLTVENCTFDGQKSGGADTVVNSHSGAMTVRANEFFNIPSDGVNIQSGTVERNYFSGSGYEPGAHADAISVQSSTGPVTIRGNYIDFVKTPGAAAEPNAALKIVQEWDTPVHDVTAEGNVLLGGGYTIYANGTAMTNVKITNNDVGLSNWGDLYPGNHGSNFVYDSNHSFATDAHLLSGGSSTPTPPVTIPTPAPAPAPAEPASPPSTSQPAPTPSAPADNATSSPSTGSSEILLRVSGDQYQGTPHFNVLVDGKTVATNLTTTAVHGNGEWANVKVTGNFDASAHKVSVVFTDDAWGGSGSADKNLYVDYIEMNGHRYQGETVAPNEADHNAAVLWTDGALDFSVAAATSTGAPTPAPTPASPIPAPSAPSTGTSAIKLHVSADQFQGTPHFNVAVDGKTVATNLTTSALHKDGAWADLTVTGDFSASPHKVSITFTDDAWGGSGSADKNLWVDYIEVNGHRYEGEAVSPNQADHHAAVLWTNGSLDFVL